MRIIFSILLIIFSLNSVNSQTISKENLTKKHSFYWDFYKTKIQSIGAYYKDELGETTLKHGKWEYFDEQGYIVEVRNYYKDKLNGKLSMFFPNGKPRYIGYFKRDKRDSVFIEYFENGKIAEEAFYMKDQLVGFRKLNYVDGRQKAVEEYIDSTIYLQEFWLPDSLHTQTVIKGNGVASYYHSTGGIKEWLTYKDGLPNGEFVERSIYGYDLITGTYSSGKKSGEWRYYYYTGDLEKVCTYVDDKLDGSYQYYFDKNRLQVEGFYKNGKKNGQWTWNTNQGKRDMTGNFKNDKQDGAWSYWYPTGELSYTANYKEDLKEGTWSYFYKDGSKFKQGTFKKDEKNGKWETWYENGNLLLSGNYINGKEDGEWINYWDNGKIKNKSTFKNGLLHGQWESYTPTGKLTLIGFYKNGFKDKIWTDFFDNGSPKDVVTFKVIKSKSPIKYGPMKGHIVYESVKNGNSISFSSKDFKRTEEGTYKNGEKHGTWTAYYPGGKVPVNTQGFKKGKLDGKMKEFDRKGLIISEIDYKDGLKHGKMKIYDKKGKVILEKKFADGIQIIEGTSQGGGFTPGR